MWTIIKIFVQLGFFDSQLAWAGITSYQEGQPDRTHLCTKGKQCVLAVIFGLGGLSVALEVYRARAILCNVEVVEIFLMLMCDDFLLLFPKTPQQVRTMYAWLCSDLACVSNSQSSCVVVEKWLHCVVLLHDKLFSASMTMLFIVTNFILAINQSTRGM